MSPLMLLAAAVRRFIRNLGRSTAARALMAIGRWLDRPSIGHRLFIGLMVMAAAANGAATFTANYYANPWAAAVLALLAAATTVALALTLRDHYRSRS
jgi:hypothetical protein